MATDTRGRREAASLPCLPAGHIVFVRVWAWLASEISPPTVTEACDGLGPSLHRARYLSPTRSAGYPARPLHACKADALSLKSDLPGRARIMGALSPANKPLAPGPR
jgi:hypothetical protein